MKSASSVIYLQRAPFRRNKTVITGSAQIRHSTDVTSCDAQTDTVK